MKASIELCQRVHKAVNAKAKASAAVDAFGATIGSWLEGAQRTLGMQQESLRSTQRLFRAVAQRLGEDASGGVGPETLFSLLERFRHQWCALCGGVEHAPPCGPLARPPPPSSGRHSAPTRGPTARCCWGTAPGSCASSSTPRSTSDRSARPGNPTSARKPSGRWPRKPRSASRHSCKGSRCRGPPCCRPPISLVLI